MTRFLYHAHAVGLSGRITKPFPATLEVQAPSALPTSGGYSSARRRNVRIRKLFHCAHVQTETTGSFNEEKKTHDTSATARVEGFNLQEVVTVEGITVRVSSSHPTGEDKEPYISVLGTAFEGLRIAGQDIRLESMVDIYDKENTMTLLETRYKDDSTFRTWVQQTAMIGQREAMEDERMHKFFPWCHRKAEDELPIFRGTTILPLFRILNLSVPGFTVVGNVVYVKNFGRIHIGELIVSKYERRINALHVDLGSPTSGGIDAGAVGCNGSTNDPPVGQ